MSHETGNRFEVPLLLALLVVLAAVRVPCLVQRAVYYNEALTLLEVSGHPRPSWPSDPVPASVGKEQLEGATIAGRRITIHPSLYYWGLSQWRKLFGDSIEAARAFSMPFSLATVLLVYLLARAARMKHPLVPTLFFGLTMGSVHFAHEARNYSMSCFFVTLGALLAYAGSQTPVTPRGRAVGYASALGVSCGLAFYTHYLTLFPIGVILLWFLLFRWRASRVLAILPAVLAAVPLAAGLLVSRAAEHRPGAGGGSLSRQLVSLAEAHLMVLFTGIYIGFIRTVLVWVLLIALLVFGIWQLRRVPRGMDGKLVLLLAGLAAAPFAGVLLLHLWYGRYFYEPRYTVLAGPALAIFISYGLLQLVAVKRRLGLCLLTALPLLQLTGINWTYEKPPSYLGGSEMRTFAATVRARTPASQVVAIGAGAGRGVPGTVVYELDPSTMMLVFDEKTDLEGLASAVERYEDVWVVFSGEPHTAGVEKKLVERLVKLGRQPSGPVAPGSWVMSVTRLSKGQV